MSSVERSSTLSSSPFLGLYKEAWLVKTQQAELLHSGTHNENKRFRFWSALDLNAGSNLGTGVLTLRVQGSMAASQEMTLIEMMLSRIIEVVDQWREGNEKFNDNNKSKTYFDYIAMLAVEGLYDKMEALLNQNIHPVDILLMLAASEGDKPKLEELLRAGANHDVQYVDGRTALDRASSEEINEYILGFSVQKA